MEGVDMSLKIKNSVLDPKYMDKLVNQKLKDSLKQMSDDIYLEAKRREPPQPVKDSFADKMRRVIHGAGL